MDRISEQKNEWADRGDRPYSRGEEKKAMLLNQIFSLCSVCRHNGCFSLEKLTGWHFLLWDGPVQIRGNWFNGSALMAQKATSSVDTFLFSLFFLFFLSFACPRSFLSLLIRFTPNFLYFLRSTDCEGCRCVCERVWTLLRETVWQTGLEINSSGFKTSAHSLGPDRMFS